MTDRIDLQFFHNGKEDDFTHSTQAVVLATGYETRVPLFLQNVKERLSFDDKGRFAVQRNYSIDKNGSSVFVQNAELPTHGFNAADLGLGVYRNSVIINSL